MHLEGTGAQILVACLRRAGINTLFGVPGDTGVALYDALYDVRSSMRHILARDERSAAQMADAYARCTNRVGVVEASSGGGATYVVGGLGEPFAASVPLLVLTSDIHRASHHTGALTEIDQTLLFAAVTTWAGRAETAAAIPTLLATALRAATSGRPAPVSLVLPEDVLDEQASVTFPDDLLSHATTALPRERSAAAAEDLEAAVGVLQAARRPAIMAGSGIHLSEAWGALERLAEQAAIPVATTIHGKGSLAETSPWSLGVAGANGARPYANAYLASADVVLFVGTRANATDTNGYTSPPRHGPTVIGLDIAEERAGRTYPGSLRLVGDARTVLCQLREALAPASPERRARLCSWLAAQRAAWPGAASAQTRRGPAAGLDPAAVISALHEAVGGEAIVVADPGTPTPYVAAYWETTRAGRRIIVPRGHGPMGYAIPAAIGAALGHPGQRIVAFTADGSFAMSCGELETACRLRLPITYVQFTNGSLGWIKMLQHLYLERRYFGVDLGPIDAAMVARGCGLPAARPTTLQELTHTFELFGQEDGPAFIDVMVPDEITAVPPVAPWQAALAGEKARPVY